MLGEKSNLILCFLCRPEQAEPDSCLGKLKNWCLNCVVSESSCFQEWFCQLSCSEEALRAASAARPNTCMSEKCPKWLGLCSLVFLTWGLWAVRTAGRSALLVGEAVLSSAKLTFHFTEMKADISGCKIRILSASSCAL